MVKLPIQFSHYDFNCRKIVYNLKLNLNRILLPGGATWFNQTNGYSEAGRFMYDIAMEMNDRGDFFPIWGTCLGFELLTYLSAKNVEHRADCKSMAGIHGFGVTQIRRNSGLD